ncbi:hypothetical protein EJB05_11955, partial [Eragrostis curvula]
MATHARSVRSHLEFTASPQQLPPLTDDLLEEIFLRIACPADLARASAACAAFRRYRSHHPPLLLGFLNLYVAESFPCAEAPHPNAAAAAAATSWIAGCWMACASSNWDDLISNKGFGLGWPRYVYGCFYFKVRGTTKLLKLDMNRKDFSIVNLTPDPKLRNIVIVEAEKGSLGMFCRNKHGQSVDYYTIMRSESEKAWTWQMENTIPMPANYRCLIAGEAEGYIFLVGVPRGTFLKLQDTKLAVCFSLQIKTGEIKRVSTIRQSIHHVRPYFGFPAFLAPRRI